MNIKKVLLAPFLFLISFIKHFFIGLKFVFFDSFIDINNNLKNKKAFQKRQQKVSLNRSDEKALLIKEMEQEIKNREVIKEYYSYDAIDENGQKIHDTMLATNKMTLNNFLANEGLKVQKIKKNTILNFLKKIGYESERKLSTKELIFWLTGISTYLKAGLTLNNAIKIMAEQAKNDRHKSKLYRSILYDLTLGENFSVALANQGNIFPPLLINMVRSAEATGDLIYTLEDMAKYYTEIDKTRKEMLSAIIYPVILFVFSLAILTFIMVYIIPEFIKVYNQAGITINGFTLAIVNISNFLTANLSTILLILLLIILSSLFLYRKSSSFKKATQTIGMHIPFFGKIIIYHEVTLFTKTFASLLRNSVYITNSMEILSNVTNNEVFKDIMFETIVNISKGEKISKAFEKKWCIPDVAYYMINTGEATGELSLMMEKVAAYYSDLHKSKVTNFKSFLEPIMILLLAFIVGVIILAVVVPMFSLYGQIN